MKKVLNSLDFIDFNTCIDCIKGKQINQFKKGAKRSIDVLEIIHSNIRCPDMDAHGPKYFISFIDDFLDVCIFICFIIKMKS